MLNSRFNYSIIFLLFLLFGCTGHSRDPIGRYMAPPEPLTSDDVIIVKQLSDFDTSTNLEHWYIETDDVQKNERGEPGNSIGFIFQVTGYESIGALRVNYTLGPSYQYRYVNVGIGDAKYVGVVGKDLMLDVSDYDGIHFWMKGSGNEVRLKIFTKAQYLGPYPASVSDTTNSRNYNWDAFGYWYEKTPREWTEYFVLFSSLYQEGWGKKSTFDKSHVTKILFETASMINGETGYFLIDDVSFFVLK